MCWTTRSRVASVIYVLASEMRHADYFHDGFNVTVLHNSHIEQSDLKKDRAGRDSSAELGGCGFGLLECDAGTRACSGSFVLRSMGTVE